MGECVMTDIDRAVNSFKEGYNCAQAIVSTFGTIFGMNSQTSLKIASGFGAGMGGMGETCGAVTGAFMVIGLSVGRTRVENVESKEKTYTLVQEFVKEFTARNSSIKCKELLGFDLNTPEGRTKAREESLTKTLCPKFVKDSAEILETI